MRVSELTVSIKAFFDSFYGRNGLIWALALIVILLFLPLGLPSESYWLHLLFSAFLFATFGHAWNLMAGYAGLLSFGQQVFIGLGAFAQAIVFYYGNVPIWLAWPVAGIVSALFAWLLCLPLKERGARQRIKLSVGFAVVLWVLYEWLIFAVPEADLFGSHYIRRVALLLMIFLGALPLLKLQGAYFAIATWLIAEAVATVFNGWNLVGAGGGMQLKSDVTAYQLYYAALGLLLVSSAVIWRWMRSSYGLALTAVRDDEDAARSSGVDVNKIKSVVFLVSGGMTGLAAGLYYMDVVIITPSNAFSISWAAIFVFVVVAGGMGSVAGPLLGAIIYIVVDRVVGAAAGQGQLVLGVLSILLMLLLPRGLMGIVHDIRLPHRRRRKPSFIAIASRWLLGSSAAQDRSALIDKPGVVGAYWLPASPLLALCKDEPVYKDLIAGMDKVREDIERLEPDALVIYSTRWYAVLDQLWQGRRRMSGLHVDENWHELGEMSYDLRTDVSLAKACIRAAKEAGIASKLVNYDGFPIDSATVSANALLNPDGQWPSLIVSNNLYHDFDRTRVLGELVAQQADLQGKRVAVLVLGGLSGAEWRDGRAIKDDAIASATDDTWNRRILQCLEQGDAAELQRLIPDFLDQTKADMGLKHMAFALGALHGRFGETKVYAYGPQYGAGAVVAKLF